MYNDVKYIIVGQAQGSLPYDPSVSTVIARSACDEAIQTASAERLWIASLRSQ